jgi:hypothetical protein
MAYRPSSARTSRPKVASSKPGPTPMRRPAGQHHFQPRRSRFLFRRPWRPVELYGHEANPGAGSAMSQALLAEVTMQGAGRQPVPATKFSRPQAAGLEFADQPLDRFPCAPAAMGTFLGSIHPLSPPQKRPRRLGGVSQTLPVQPGLSPLSGASGKFMREVGPGRSRVDGGGDAGAAAPNDTGGDARSSKRWLVRPLGPSRPRSQSGGL